MRVWSDRHWSFWCGGAGSVGVLLLEWRGICGACRFVLRSWSASVYSSKSYYYLGALWEILRVNVATLLVKEWMIILTVFQHVLHCKISSVMPLESPTPELRFLLRRPFLAIESCFVHLWRNQVVNHFKLKSRDGVFGWKFIKDFPSSHLHKWKRFGPGLFWCITFFFKLFDVCCVLVLCYYFFFNFRIIILVDRKCWLCGHNHLYITQGHIIIYFFVGTNSVFACFQMYIRFFV